jgi:septal ring factor EnvC (AmiA/AmiB activator)
MSPLETTQLIAMAGGGLLAFAYAIQKFLGSWQLNNAESSIITLMRSELERMADQNTKLSVELGKLQEEMILLNKQLRILTEENQRLHTEVVSLTNQIATLQKMLK